MASVHFKKKLIHRCTIQRAVETRTASGAVKQTFGDEYTDRPCRYVQRTERQATEEQSFQRQLIHLLLFDYGEDVTAKDRISDITLAADGSSVNAGPFDIEHVLERNTGGHHHLSLELERVTRTET